MDEAQALEVIQALADGVNPATGEQFPLGSPYQQPDTVRALVVAAQSLQRQQEYNKRRAGLPANVGKAWSGEEDRRLAAEFEAAKSLREMAELHQRTTTGIKARLEKLGILSADVQPP